IADRQLDGAETRLRPSRGDARDDVAQSGIGLADIDAGRLVPVRDPVGSRHARLLGRKEAAALSASARRGSSPLDAAQETARPRGVDIDKVGARAAQTPLDQRIDLPPVPDLAETVEPEIAAVEGAD